MSVDISIIIPCYNTGEFLTEAIQSVEAYRGKYKYEIIIVDDGSTEPVTVALLDKLSSSGYTIIHQSNGGLGNARNNGCKNATGEYLLFLDSDNKIDPAYIDKGIEHLKAGKKIAVVYGNPVIFGDDSRPGFTSGPFDIKKLMAFNYIDACAVVRKKAWNEVNGFKEERSLMGITDWEFWIRLYKAGWFFQFINEPLYYYRIRKDSMASVEADSRREKLKMYEIHADLVSTLYIQLYNEMEIQQQDLKWSPTYRVKKIVSKIKNPEKKK
jgi:glycosyltransferase involved in cell wall biosynthesis